MVIATNIHVTQAIRTRAIGYILKPVTNEAIRESLQETRFSTAMVKRAEN